MADPALILNAPPADPPWAAPRFRGMPGTALIGPDDWLMISDAYDAQMALRDRLVAERPGAVMAAMPGAGPGLAEALETLLDGLSRRPGYAVGLAQVTRPDGVSVPLGGDVLVCLARLVQEDLCLMQEGADGEYVLTAASLCFPHGWTLSEKLGHGMIRIHAPIAEYSAQAAARVARLFTGLKPGLPICRHNGGPVAHGDLFAPFTEAETLAARKARVAGPYYRSERQCLLRLPRTGAVLFSIHTRIWHLDDLEGLEPRPGGAASAAHRPV